ncbi:MAG: hypothetical protein ACXWXJ_03195, partial [Aeromicrobium sp.]
MLRVNGRLHHIDVGRTHARTHVILLIQDLHGDYQRRDEKPLKKPPNLQNAGSGVSDVLRHHNGRAD